MKGQPLAKTIIARVRKEFIQSELYEKGVSPLLDIILANGRDDSRIYIDRKVKALESIGFQSRVHVGSSINQIKNLIDKLNNDLECDGIIVQAPLDPLIASAHDYCHLVKVISLEKDVDGVNTMDILAFTAANEPKILPCTPSAVIHLIEYYMGFGYLRGKHVAILGCSPIVGMPLSLMIIRKGATVTVCHRGTLDIPKITRQVDVLVSCTGHPLLVKSTWIKPGAVIVDVGISRIPSTLPLTHNENNDDAENRDNYLCNAKNTAIKHSPHENTTNRKIVGDVDFDKVFPLVSAITPVPGGVGPLTVAFLISNVWLAAQSRRI